MGDSKKLYIGLGISITGDDSQVGQAVMQGIAMGIREINSAERNIKFVIVIKDDNSNPDKAREIARSFVEDNKISIVIGHGRSSCTLAAGKIYNEGKLPDISPISTNPVISNIGPYIFRTCGSDMSQARTLVDIAMNKLKVKNIAIMCNLYEPYSNSLSSFVKKYSLNNLNIVCQENYSFNDSDFTLQVLNIINKSPDLVFIAGYDVQALSIIKQLREKGFKGYIMGGDALYTQRMINQGKEYVDGFICTTFFHPDISSNDTFVKDFRKLFGGGTPNPIAAQAYDSIKLISCALDDSIDRNSLQKNLSEIGSKGKRFRGLTGEINFTEHRESGNWIVVKIHGGKYIPL
jgi:branched-chain amino acid transport system substrate-binding protein